MHVQIDKQSQNLPFRCVRCANLSLLLLLLVLLLLVLLLLVVSEKRGLAPVIWLFSGCSPSRKPLKKYPFMSRWSGYHLWSLESKIFFKSCSKEPPRVNCPGLKAWYNPCLRIAPAESRPLRWKIDFFDHDIFDHIFDHDCYLAVLIKWRWRWRG